MTNPYLVAKKLRGEAANCGGCIHWLLKDNCASTGTCELDRVERSGIAEKNCHNYFPKSIFREARNVIIISRSLSSGRL